LGWGGSTKNMEKDDKSYSPRGLRHCFSLKRESERESQRKGA
jgi:hypothetical protein